MRTSTGNPWIASPPRRTDLDDLGDTTSGGTPTGSGISGNEVPAVPDALELEDEEDEDEDPYAASGRP